jgi:hypothetical protein
MRSDKQLTNKTMIKQSFGPYLAIGGSPEKINPLFLSLWNHGAVNGELLDLGNPEVFVYFLVTEEKFLKARAIVHAQNHSRKIGFNHNQIQGQQVWSAAKEAARIQLDSIENETFLSRDQILVDFSDLFHISEFELEETMPISKELNSVYV